MEDKKSDPYQEGARGAQFTGSTVEDSLEYSRGKRDQSEGRGGGMVVATVLLSPLICAAYPIAGLATIGTAMLVSRGGPLVGFKEASGVLILVTLVATVAAFFAGLVAERRVSRSKAYRIVRWILRLLLAPGVVVSMMVSGGSEEVGIGRFVVLILLVPACYWFLKGLDRFVGATGQA